MFICGAGYAVQSQSEPDRGQRAVTWQLHLGLPDALRADAAAIYWDAFGGKLGRMLGPEAKALAFLRRAMRADHCITVIDGGGRLLGLAGFKTPNGAFAGGETGDLRAIYGRIGALWRMAVLRLLEREVENTRFLLDGICVAPTARGQGVGTALIGAICDEARARGYHGVRLDVIDSNPRAKALYERLGFTVSHTDRIGLLRHVFGFSSATAMVRDLD